MDTKGCNNDDANTVTSVEPATSTVVNAAASHFHQQQQYTSSLSKSGQDVVTVDLEKVQSIEPAKDNSEDADSKTASAPKSRLRRVIERAQYVLLVVGIVLSMFMCSLNTTVVAPAMNIIATELDAVRDQTWIATSYLLAMLVFQVLAGKFSDIFGRKPIVLFGLILFVVGSIINSTSYTINVLIVGRTIQGFGAGGIISMVFVIITDIVPIHLRPRFQSMLMVVYGLSSVVGPLIGGGFVDHVTWRWDFWINVIIGGCCTIIIAFLFKEPSNVAKSSFWEKFKRVDFLGTLFSIGFICCLLLALNWGSQYGWDEPHTYGSFIGAGVSLVLLVISEGWIAREPLMPPQVMMNPAIGVIYCYMMAMGLSFIGTLYFGPILFQAVFGANSTESGVRLVPYMCLLIVGSIGSGYLLVRFRQIKYYLMFAAASNVIGYGLFYTVNEQSNWGQQAGFLTFCGLAFGLSQQNCILAVQQIAPKEYIAVATTLVNFFMMFASSVGIAIFQTLYLTFLQSQALGLDKETLMLAQKYGALQNYLNIRDMPIEAQEPVIGCYMRALHTVFILPLIVAGLGFICTLFIKDVRFMGPGASANKKPADEEQGHTMSAADDNDDNESKEGPEKVNISITVNEKRPPPSSQSDEDKVSYSGDHNESQNTIR